MNRFFAQPEGETATLSAADTHHLKRVLRARIGDAVEIAHNGHAYTGEIVALDPLGRVRITGEAASGEPELVIRLVQALVKGDKMDWIVQKAVELGVTSIQPVSTRYSDVKLTGERAAKKVEHWQHVAEAAAKQCKRSRIPGVFFPKPLAQAIEEAKGSRIVFCYEKAEESLFGLHNETPIHVFIGPEGGFSEEEVLLFKEAGARPVSLGPRILRTETAGIVALTLIQCQAGDMR